MKQFFLILAVAFTSPAFAQNNLIKVDFNQPHQKATITRQHSDLDDGIYVRFEFSNLHNDAVYVKSSVYPILNKYDAMSSAEKQKALATHYFYCSFFSSANDPSNPTIWLSPLSDRDDTGTFYTWLDVVKHRTKDGKVGALLSFDKGASLNKIYLTFSNESGAYGTFNYGFNDGSYTYGQGPEEASCLKPMTEVELTILPEE
jgi:hypothetical protein